MDQSENQETTQSNEAEEPMTMGAMNAAEVQRLQKELNEVRDKYLRVLAEMENARKRAIKERQEGSQQAIADVITEFLKPLDNMENALNYAEKMSEEVKNWAIGFQMILTQFKDVLAAHGVAPISAKGSQFDPHLHEAIEIMETDDHPHGTVVEEFTKGYQMGKKTIRPARVKVAQELRLEEIPEESDKNQSEE